MSTEIGKVLSTEITSELSTSYLDYAMSVIVARALTSEDSTSEDSPPKLLEATRELALPESEKSLSCHLQQNFDR
jgi:hypothetical protein